MLEKVFSRFASAASRDGVGGEDARGDRGEGGDHRDHHRCFSLVGTVFLFAACLHWRFCARRAAALPVRRQSARFTFAKPQPAMTFAVLS